jgi:protoporphyrinogen oxidase
VILGGGLAGLAAARAALATQACRVTILEREARPGGMAISLNVRGTVSDLGPHRIYSAIPAMREWFHRVLGERMFVVERRSRMFVNGQFLNYPLRAAEAVRAFSPFRLGLFAAGYAWARARTLAGRLPERSFAQAMERSFGRPLCEAMVFPYVRKTWHVEPEALSVDVARARATMGGLSRIARRALHPGAEPPGEETSLKRFHYIRGGIEGLARQLADEVRAAGGRIVCGADVRRLETSGGRVRRVSFLEGGETREIALGDADFVLATIPLPDLASALLYGGLEATGLADAAHALRYVSTILTMAVVRRPSLSADTWLYFPQEEPALTRAYESKNFDPSLGPAGETVVCIENTALPGDAELRRNDAALATDYIGRLAATGLFAAGEVAHSEVHRIDKAYPLYEAGYGENLDRIWGGLRTVRNLLPLGRQALFQHNNMDHTIYTALRAVACWTQEAQPVAVWYGRELPEFRQFRIVD